LDEIVWSGAKKGIEVRWKDIYEGNMEILVKRGLLSKGDTYETKQTKLSQKFNEYSLNKIIVLHEGYMKFSDSKEK
jgi:hypothetical protein